MRPVFLVGFLLMLAALAIGGARETQGIRKGQGDFWGVRHGDR